MVAENALSDATCVAMIEDFERSDRAAPGVTGHGLDPEKKRSVDITLDRFPEWAGHLSTLANASRALVAEYCTTHHFTLIGALSPMVRQPGQSQLVTVKADNWTEIGTDIAARLTWRLYRLGPFTIQKYTRLEGGYPHWHSEVYPQEAGRQSEALHRVLFTIFYLNDVEAGGETEFFYQQRLIQPKTGRALLAPTDSRIRIAAMCHCPATSMSSPLGFCFAVRKTSIPAAPTPRGRRPLRVLLQC